MLFPIVAFAAAAVAAPADKPAAAEDPIVCKSAKEHVVGTRVKRAPICKPKSVWAMESRDAQRELQQFRDRWQDPGRADSGR